MHLNQKYIKKMKTNILSKNETVMRHYILLIISNDYLYIYLVVQVRQLCEKKNRNTFCDVNDSCTCTNCKEG